MNFFAKSPVQAVKEDKKEEKAVDGKSFSVSISRRRGKKKKSSPAARGSDLMAMMQSVKAASPDAVLGAQIAGALLVDEKTVYRIRLAIAGSLSANGAGTFYSYVTCNPSINAEWSYLSGLFGMCRLYQSTIHLVPQNYQAPTDGIMVGFNLNYTATAPANYQSMYGIPKVKLVNTQWNSASSVVLRSPVLPNSLWADVAAPVPAMDSGCWGCWQFSGTAAGSLAANSQVFAYLHEMILEFRARE